MTPELSVIVPVFNEKNTLQEIIQRIRRVPVDKEIIIVDDGSSDGTREIITKNFSGLEEVKIFFHKINQGKGSAVRTGIQAAQGCFVIFQDADLEYDPEDYPALLEAIKTQNVKVVYGSRFLSKKKVTSPWHRAVNFFLTTLTNILFGSKLTDMETCYKLFQADFLKSIPLQATGFEMEVEITGKVLKRGEVIAEIPVRYQGRPFHEGKKIGWKDGLKAVYYLFRYRFQ